MILNDPVTPVPSSDPLPHLRRINAATETMQRIPAADRLLAARVLAVGNARIGNTPEQIQARHAFWFFAAELATLNETIDRAMKGKRRRTVNEAKAKLAIASVAAYRLLDENPDLGEQLAACLAVAA